MYEYVDPMLEEQDRITLVCTSHNPDYKLLDKMLASAVGFDEVIVHINGTLIKHNDLIYKFKDELSIPDAYNYLIKNYVKTQWVCCFCDDDYFYTDGLKKMIKEVHEGIVASVAHFKFHVSGYCPPQDLRAWWFGKEYDLSEKRQITPKLLSKHGRLPAGSFFRKRAWEMVSGFQGDKCHDWDLWQRMSAKGIEFKYFDYLVYNFVRRNNSAWIRQNR